MIQVLSVVLHFDNGAVIHSVFVKHATHPIKNQNFWIKYFLKRYFWPVVVLHLLFPEICVQSESIAQIMHVLSVVLHFDKGAVVH